MVAQMIEYAGCPKDFLPPKVIIRGMRDFYSLHGDMEKLVELAGERDKES